MQPQQSRAEKYQELMEIIREIYELKEIDSEIERDNINMVKLKVIGNVGKFAFFLFLFQECQ